MFCLSLLFHPQDFHCFKFCQFYFSHYLILCLQELIIYTYIKVWNYHHHHYAVISCLLNFKWPQLLVSPFMLYLCYLSVSAFIDICYINIVWCNSIAKPNSPSNYEILQFKIWAPLNIVSNRFKVFLMSHLLT